MEDSKSINTDFNIIKKIFVNYTVIIFGFIIILIFILLSLYYLTPNNYKLIKWDENKFKFENKIEYVIKPDSTTNINNNDFNKYLRFSEQTNLVVKNIFKSQNIIILNDIELITSKYNSEIFLINNSELEKKITIQFYSLN